MGQDSKIQWTTHTWNPWRGCTKVSPGCANCYAEAMSKRNPAVLGVWGDGGTRVVASESQWREPLKWDRAAKAAGERHRVFCASLADVFEDWDGQVVGSQGGRLLVDGLGAWRKESENVTGRDWDKLTLDHARDRLFDLIDATPNLDWLLLTKRPENLDRMLPWTSAHAGQYRERVWPNVWVGTTVENQEQADKRIPILLKIPAAVRFLSVEPMLGRVDLGKYLGFQHEDEIGIENPDQSLPREQGVPFHDPWVRGPDWVICGGESGAKARNFNIHWARDLRDQCKAAGAPFFMKQLGAKPFTNNFGGAFRAGGFLSLSDSHGADPDEWPEDLRVREFPALVPAS